MACAARLGGLPIVLRSAADDAGIKQVIIPARNMAEVEAEVPESVRQALSIVPVRRLEEVLRHAFEPPMSLRAAPKL